MKLVKDISQHSKLIIRDLAYEYDSLNKTITLPEQNLVELKVLTLNGEHDYFINSVVGSNYILLELKSNLEYPLVIKFDNSSVLIEDSLDLNTEEYSVIFYSIYGYSNKVILVYNKKATPSTVEIERTYLKKLSSISAEYYQVISRENKSIVDLSLNKYKTLYRDTNIPGLNFFDMLKKPSKLNYPLELESTLTFTLAAAPSLVLG